MSKFPMVALILMGALVHAHASPKPNVLLILADDLGFSDIGCYGGEIATPNLDALAAGGLRFTHCYNTARCWPSRAALLTGYYAQQVRRDTVPGVTSGSAGVRPAWAKLLPERLRAAGYRSYHSGKWHIDGKPTENGFDRSYNLTDHDRYFSPRTHQRDDQPLPAVNDAEYYATKAIADHAIECLREHAGRHAGAPFFHYLCFNAPHFPLQAPAEDRRRYDQRYADGWEVIREQRMERLRRLGIFPHSLPAVERDVGPPYAFPKALEALGENEVNRPLPWLDLRAAQREFQARKMAIHAAMIDRMDREIGRVLAQLKTMGAWENTLILFASDNGASAEIMVRGDGHDRAAEMGSARTFLSLGPGWSSAANTPFRRHKTWVHEGGIATPLIAHWPQGLANHGGLSTRPTHFIDIAPTILELAGIPKDNAGPAWEGKSLVDNFTQPEAAEERPLWWLHEGNRALRLGRWKIVAAGENGPWELYDLSKDRAETDNLAATHETTLNDLASRWESQWKRYRGDATSAPAP